MADGNINDVLGIEEMPEQNNTSEYETNANNAAENTLNIIANIVLWVGIIITIVCLFTLTTNKVVDPAYTYAIEYDIAQYETVQYKTVFNPSGLAVSIGVLLSSLTTWAVLKVITNISISLKEINAKIK